MKTIKTIIGVLTLLFFFTSCEENNQVEDTNGSLKVINNTGNQYNVSIDGQTRIIKDSETVTFILPEEYHCLDCENADNIYASYTKELRITAKKLTEYEIDPKVGTVEIINNSDTAWPIKIYRGTGSDGSYGSTSYSFWGSLQIANKSSIKLQISSHSERLRGYLDYNEIEVNFIDDKGYIEFGKKLEVSEGGYYTIEYPE